jgi:MFS family permease
MSKNSNLHSYYFYRAFSEALIIGPILVLYMLYKGLNYTEIMLLQSIFSITIMIFEVPTGVIADRISRKFSLLLGTICTIVGLLIYIAGKHFLVFALAEFIFGIGRTLKSGSDSALIYDFLKEKSEESQYHLVESKGTSYSFFVQAFGSLLSGYLYEINKNIPFFISSTLVGLALISVLFIREPKLHTQKMERSYISHTFKSFKLSFKIKRVFWLVLFAILITSIYRVSFWLYQPHFLAVGFRPAMFGVLFFVFNIVAALFSRFSHKILGNKRPRNFMMGLSLLFSLSFLLSGVVWSKIGVLFLLLQQMYRGLIAPTTKFYINLEIPSDKRATIISIQSFAGNLSFALMSPFIGVLLEIFKVRNLYFMLSIYMLLAILILYFVRKKQKRSFV